MPCEHTCFVSERHNVLHQDERGRLHCENGPAVAYPDGWAVYAVHGVRVPERVIMQPESITADDIRNEQNAEVRRVMLARYGEERWLRETNAQPVHQDRFGTLYRLDDDVTLVRVVDASTARVYFLQVDPSAYNGDAGRIAQAAVASTWRNTDREMSLFFRDWRDYAPEVET